MVYLGTKQREEAKNGFLHTLDDGKYELKAAGILARLGVIAALAALIDKDSAGNKNNGVR